MLLNFLNDNNVLKLKVLMAFEGKNNVISIDELADEVSSSEYLVTKAIDNLIFDVKRIGLPNPLFTIKQVDNKVIQYLRRSSLSPLNYLAYIYSLESDFYTFFKNFINESAGSQVNFLNDNFISKTSFFRLRKKFDKSLSPFNLKISSRVTLSGSEQDIRNFLYIYLINSHFDIKLPFSPGVENQLEKLVDSIEVSMKTNFSNSIKLKLKYYFYVILCRNRLKHFLIIKENYTFNHQMDVISELVKTNLNISTELEARNIVINLFQFLFSEGVSNDFYPEDNPEILNIIGDIRKHFSSFFEVSAGRVNSIFTSKVNLALAQFLIHCKYFNYPLNYTISSQNISYLNENFSEYQSFSEDVVDIMSSHWAPKKNLLKINHIAISNDLLFLIVANFNLSQLFPPIIVAVDFTYGENYSELIANEIKNFTSLNLEVSRSLSDDTDILISNLSPHVMPTIHKIQWTSPPTPSDWEFLGNLIVNIKKERRTDHEQ